jgi:hypothetical protein
MRHLRIGTIAFLLALAASGTRLYGSAQQHERGSFALLGRRVAAYLVDMLLLFAVLAPAGQLLLWLLGAETPRTGPAIGRVILAAHGALSGVRLASWHISAATAVAMG